MGLRLVTYGSRQAEENFEGSSNFDIIFCCNAFLAYVSSMFLLKSFNLSKL